MITGMVSWPPVAHSFKRVIPSASGIQISSSTRSGRPCARNERAAVAFSASWTECPSSERISDKSSRIPTSSSTTSICAMVDQAASGSEIRAAAPQGDVLLEVGLNASSGLFVQGKYLRDESVQIQSAQLRRRRAGIVAEIIHHVLHGGDLRDDGLRGVVERARRLDRKFVAEFRLQPLRRELDRRERVLDLVSEPARDLAPGRRALRRDQLRDVVEYHDVATATRLGQRRTAYENHCPTLAHLDLLLPRGSFVLFELRLQHASKLGERAPILELQSNQGRNVLVQDAARPAVCNPEDEAMIENEYARRQIGENALQVRLCGFELRLIEQSGALRLAQLLSHAVERLREDAQLIAARDPGAARKIAASHRLGALGEHSARSRHAAPERERKCDRRKQSEQQRQGQRENVDLLQPLARQRQLLVCTIHALH